MGVGGTDTARGISFQHAQAVAACLDVLESDVAALLRVEGDDDVIDFEICAADSRRLRICQAKTRKEPYTWGPAPLIAIIKRWGALSKADQARFAFLTDGSVGPAVAERLQPALRRARKGELTDEDCAYLTSKDLDPNGSILKRVAIESRQPDADVILDGVAVRLLRLLQMRMPSATIEQAEALVNSLFRIVSKRSGLDDADERVITREELSELVDIGLDVIDRASRWTPGAADTYKCSLRNDPPRAALVGLQAQPIRLAPDALAYVVREVDAPEQQFLMPASEVLGEPSGAVISGPAGAGKTTTLELLAHAALERGQLPVLVSVENYGADSIGWLVREAVERHLGGRLAPGATTALLGNDDVTLLLDGAGELDSEAREALVFDVQALQRLHPALRVVVASRDAARMRALNLPSFVLQGLDHGLRRTIATELLGTEDDRTVTSVEQRLGTLVDNPLLFVMALAQTRDGIEARNRAELFDGFVEGLRARGGAAEVEDVVIALLCDACFALREDDRYSADRWTWRRLLATGMGRLAAAGLFAAESIDADQALQAALDVGLLRTLPGSGGVALTHDLFCDYFAAEAVRCSPRELPAVVPEALEELAIFLAERGGLSAAQARSIVSNPVAAARCAAAAAEGEATEDEVEELYGSLSAHLGRSLKRDSGAAGTARVRVALLEHATYVFALAGGEDPPGPGLALDTLASAALSVVSVAPGTTSLGAAVALWFADLRRALAHVDCGELSVIPEAREELPAVLVAAYGVRRGHVDEVCACICPGLRDRIARHLGMQGFRAIVLPADTFTVPIAGGQEITQHQMVYSYNAPDVAVRLCEEIDEGWVEEPRSSIAAEDWLRETPDEAARADVRSSLIALLPGFMR